MPLAALLSALLVAPPDSLPASAADSAATRTPRVIRQFEQVLVRASAYDPRSTETTQAVTSTQLWGLPVDDLQAALAARAGVVIQGEDLHVRGGRTGELATEFDGLGLNDALRDGAFPVPILSLDGAELITGGLEADHAGALAGALVLHPVTPPPHPQGVLEWQTDGGLYTRYDRVLGRGGVPLAHTGYGLVAAAEATLDDTHLPAERTESTHSILGVGSFGWRADNRLRAHARLAPLEGEGGLRFDAFAARTLEQPYNPMFALDGWTTPCADPESCLYGPAFRPDSAAGYERYKGPDHVALSDDRRLALIAAWSRRRGALIARASAGLVRADRLLSVGLREDAGGVTAATLPVFGLPGIPFSDPFHVYRGDEPIFRTSRADRWAMRVEFERAARHGGFTRVGLSARYDDVRLTEVDGMSYGHGLDSLRTYHAYAPGGAAWIQSRIVFEGLVANLGARIQVFSAGPQASAQSLENGEDPRTIVSFLPRLGVAFPVGVRDALSFAYTRVDQDPARDFLYDNRLRVTNHQPVGDPALEPATMISYQVALKHVWSERVSMQTAFFYRDLYGLIGTRWEEAEGFAARPTYENADQGHAAGFEASLAARLSDVTHAEFHYTYANARGPASLEEGARFGIPLGARPPPLAAAPLDWDRRHSFGLEGTWRSARGWRAGLITIVGSGFPWTPRPTRQVDPDLSDLNSRRLGWSEQTDVQLGYAPPALRGHVTFALEARNLFDFRGERMATIDGYPNPVINTLYDDYGAYRTATGSGGGAFYDDANADGTQEWNPVGDQRLGTPPREVRLSIRVGG